MPALAPLVATAIVATIGSGAAFHKGREFSSWLGLVPRQHSTGGKARLFGISKRGNSYLRKLLVHGAHLPSSASSENDPRSVLRSTLLTPVSVKVVITAAANKLARIAWAVLSSGRAIGRFQTHNRLRKIHHHPHRVLRRRSAPDN